MSRIGDGAARGTQATRARATATAQLDRENRARGLEVGWTVFSYLLAGMVSYGAIGWLIGKAVHAAILFPLGMIVGLAISVGFVIYRYGRQAAVDGQGSVERNDR
jgi:ATP synthase protein I